jgi:hypothetical protein
MKWKPIVLIVLAAAVLLGLFAYRRASHRRDLIETRAQLVKTGMSERDVVAMLGPADRVLKPCLSGAQQHECDKDLVYDVPLEFDSFWTVSLDASGHVISRFHWRSA